MDFESWGAELASTRVYGAGPDRLAQAAVDGTGKLVDLRLDPNLMRRPPGAVAKEVMAAVVSAQEAARAQGAKHAAGLEEVARRASADVEAYRHEAERRMEELQTLVSDLIRSRERVR